MSKCSPRWGLISVLLADEHIGYRPDWVIRKYMSFIMVKATLYLR
jgi:hypothetical protein